MKQIAVLRSLCLRLPNPRVVRCYSSSGIDYSDVVIALGSNLGDRGQNLWRALRSIEGCGIKVLRHSALYETVPAYVTDQPSFLNAAVLARSQHAPMDLLRVLKDIEAKAGRDLSVGTRFGPRPLDLDIIFYDGLQLSHDHLTIPHPRWQERSFVKAPVADLYRELPAGDSWSLGGNHQGVAIPPLQHDAHPSMSGSMDINPELLKSLKQVHQAWKRAEDRALPTGGDLPYTSDAAAAAAHSVLPTGQGEVMQRVMPLPDGRLMPWGKRTHVMAILNATPDSFSDGGRLLSGGINGALQKARELVEQGADILDVGGQSTRPGAVQISDHEEAARVIPLIRAMKQDPALKGAVISIDTYYASVAREAVAAGASMVNDVSGGSHDKDMLAQVASLGVPYVLMHMRGDLSTMQQSQNVHYNCTWRDVGTELQTLADRAVSAGIASWNIVLDPGIGFSKTAEGNMELIRHLGDMRKSALQGGFRHGPLLVGPSRKGFLGSLIGRKDPAERDAATVACAVACVAGDGLADILRVHNVRDVRDGLKVADAVYRS